MPRDSEKHMKYGQKVPPSGKTSRAGLIRRVILVLLAAVAWGTSASADGWQHAGAVQRVEKLKDGVELSAGRAKVRITAFRDGVIRVRVAPQGTFPKDSSWAVVETPEPPSVKIEDAKNELRLTTGRFVVIV